MWSETYSRAAYQSYFDPLAPGGARPNPVGGKSVSPVLRSTRSAWGETWQAWTCRRHRCLGTSIHSPCVGRDLGHHGLGRRDTRFDPLTPRRVRPRCNYIIKRNRDFDPLAPFGARRWHCTTCDKYFGGFNPLAPRGARPAQPACACHDRGTSIHSPVQGETPPACAVLWAVFLGG